MSVLVVTGTDTGVGKTVVTAAVAAAHLSRGLSVAVVKPAQTGVLPGEAGDLEEVRRLAGPVETREGSRLPDPLAPATAARVAGRSLPSLRTLRDLVLEVDDDADTVLVEGAGGVTVRLGENYTLLDLAVAVARADRLVEVVVVARAGLGTLNHSALTVDAVRARRLPVLGLVIGSASAEPGLAERLNLEDLPAYTGVPLLGSVPEGAAAVDPDEFRARAAGWLPGL